MKRKQAQQILNGLGVSNKFSLKTVGFGDLARGRAQFLTIKGKVPNWNVCQPIKDAFRPHGVIVDFDGALFS